MLLQRPYVAKINRVSNCNVQSARRKEVLIPTIAYVDNEGIFRDAWTVTSSGQREECVPIRCNSFG